MYKIKLKNKQEKEMGRACEKGETVAAEVQRSASTKVEGFGERTGPTLVRR